jgi:uncharacterized membrane protein
MTSPALAGRIAAMTPRQPPRPATRRDRLLAVAGLAVLALIAIAAARRAMAAPIALAGASPWLVLHVATIVLALPLGAFVLANPKGDRRHRACGRIWAALMIVAALTSFGLHGLLGHLGPIHLLSLLTLVAVPRAVWAARTGRIAAHRRTMLIVYASMVVAGLFTFVPGRMLGDWLFG